MNETTVLNSTRSGASYHLGASFRIGAYTLHEAHDQEGQRRWIKQVQASDAAAIAQLRYEAIVLGKIQRPGVVTLLDRGRSTSCFFLALDPAPGRLLHQMIEAGPLPLALALGMARHLAELLGALHAQGIICRALTPEMLYADHLGRVTLVDVSLAWDEVAPPRAHPPLENALYLSPEEAGGAPPERASDIYSYGLLLFALLAGQPPFQGSNRGDLALQHLLQPPPRLADLRPDAPPELSQLLARCLAKVPAQRYRDAAGLLAALQLVLSGDGAASAATEPPANSWHWLFRSLRTPAAATIKEHE